MQAARDRGALDALLEPWRSSRQQIALVPTMGHLHEGHLALVTEARRHADRVVASIYVNPTQFGEGEDFERYPRSLERDRELLAERGCDLVFEPDLATVYPVGLDDAVRLRAPSDLARPLEGRFRPGHFDGVLTVVARLFNLVRPDVAVFGEKDYQQLLLIRRLAADMNYRIRILPVPTVREADGLAMSSRNSYLDEGQRQQAAVLNVVLGDVAGEAGRMHLDWRSLEREATARLESQGLKVDYLAIRRASDLAEPEPGDRDLRVFAAAWCGATRLIDNAAVISVGIHDH
jgi:pantoate--beta-alanine ligase